MVLLTPITLMEENSISNSHKLTQISHNSPLKMELPQNLLEIQSLILVIHLHLIVLNLFYAPIPFEFLYTNHNTPQISMTVAGLPVVCTAIECPYAYIATTEQITSFSFSAPTLTIQGTNLPSIIV